MNTNCQIAFRKKRVGKKSKNLHTSELSIENQICDFLDLKGIAYWKMKVRGDLHHAKGKTFIRKNKNAGFPDILCCFKGLFVCFEVKRPGGYQSPPQQAQEMKIKGAGGRYFLVNSFDEVQKYLEEFE